MQSNEPRGINLNVNAGAINTSPVDSAGNRLDNLIEENQRILAILASRLAPILSNPPKGETGGKPQAVGASPLVESLLRMGDKVEYCNISVNEMIDRLTL